MKPMMSMPVIIIMLAIIRAVVLVNFLNGAVRDRVIDCASDI